MNLFIDIHVHTRPRPGFPRKGKPAYATPEQLIERFDAAGIERAALLPGVSPECSWQGQTNEDVLDICRSRPGRFIPFCNVDPRELTNSPDAPLADLLAYYKAAGCKGVGEVCPNLPLDDPMVDNLFDACRRNAMPLTFHLATQVGGQYGLVDRPGLPLLERALGKFPDLVFLGHSQPFWAEIGPLDSPADRGGYPAGPVRRPGRLVELLRRYPNLHGDLSAYSGCNAVTHDEAFGLGFLEEFQDRLHFGTDICAPDTPAFLAEPLRRWRDAGTLSAEAFEKIARRNTIELLGLADKQ